MTCDEHTSRRDSFGLPVYAVMQLEVVAVVRRGLVLESIVGVVSGRGASQAPMLLML